MLNGIRPFSFIRLITWKYIRLSFALLCFFFWYFLGLNAENAFVTFAAGSNVCMRFQCEHLLLLVVPISRISLCMKQPMSTLFHMPTDRVILVLFFVFGIIGTHVIIFILHPRPTQPTFDSVDFKLFPCHSTFFSFFFVFNLIRITASLLQFEFRI